MFQECIETENNENVASDAKLSPVGLRSKCPTMTQITSFDPNLHGFQIKPT